MSEINRLRTQLKNVQKNVSEFRMTVSSARSLIIEIDELLKEKEKPPEVILKTVEQQVTSRIIDGGSF